MSQFLPALTLITVLANAHGSVDNHLQAVSKSDTTAQAVILDEMRAFYRDADTRNWTPLLNHFLPAKVTARWTPPVADPQWARLLAPDADAASGTAAPCSMRATVAVVGTWARVLARRCAAPIDEAWLLHVSGRWKIVHLERLAPTEHADIQGNTAPTVSGTERKTASTVSGTPKCEG